MTKNLLLLACLLTGFLSACEKLKDITTFNLDAHTEFTIPGQQTGIGDILSLPRMEVQTSSEQTFSNNNTRADLVEEAYLNRLSLSITAPAEANFDFLNDIQIYIRAEGEEEVLIAYGDDLPEGGSRQLELTTTGEDLSPYIKKGSYTLRTEATTDKVVDEDTDVRVDMTFAVTAKVF